MKKQLYKVVGETYSGKRVLLKEGMTREEAMEYCNKHGWEYRNNGVIYSMVMEGEAA